MNFSSKILGDISKPGIRKVINQVIQSCGENYSSKDFVDYCLMEIGALEASEKIREILVGFVQDSGLEEIDMSEHRDLAEHKIADLLRVLGSMPEFQKC